MTDYTAEQVAAAKTAQASADVLQVNDGSSLVAFQVDLTILTRAISLCVQSGLQTPAELEEAAAQ